MHFPKYIYNENIKKSSRCAAFAPNNTELCKLHFELPISQFKFHIRMFNSNCKRGEAIILSS